MKKNFFLIILIFIIIFAFFSAKYLEYKADVRQIKEDNLDFEFYLGKEVYGNEVSTLINRAVDYNEKNNVKKNENNVYIQNDMNSIEIEITTIDLEKEMTYNMESFYNAGMEKFYTLYNSILFECVKIDYNKTGRVSYMLFLQKSM